LTDVEVNTVNRSLQHNNSVQLHCHSKTAYKQFNLPTTCIWWLCTTHIRLGFRWSTTVQSHRKLLFITHVRRQLIYPNEIPGITRVDRLNYLGSLLVTPSPFKIMLML